jgi:ribose-phosphate pyrophosphokinase
MYDRSMPARHGRRRTDAPMNDDGPMLFALQASRGFGEAVSRELAVALAEHEEREFEDGEHKTRPLASVRDRDVYVIQTLHSDRAQSVNDKLNRLLFFIGALGDAGARRVTAIVPYLCYARKDRRSKPRDPVTTRYVAQMFEAVGTDCVVSLDVHNPAAYQNAFRCRAEELEANGLFVAHFAPLLRAAEVAVVSPDAGGIKRADRFRSGLSRALQRPVSAAFAEKYRSGGEVSGEALVGDVDGKVAIIIDDLIGAGSTIARTAQACRAHGAVAVHAAVSHGVFAGAANEVLAASNVETIVVTDSLPPWRVSAAGLRAKLVEVSVVPLFAEAIRRLHAGGSLAELRGE